MYPITCLAGYPVPIKVGRFEIMGVQVPASAVGTTTRITLVDSDTGTLLTDESVQGRTVVFDGQGTLSSEGSISVQFSEPIKVRKGITVSNTVNLIGGKNIVYIR